MIKRKNKSMLYLIMFILIMNLSNVTFSEDHYNNDNQNIIMQIQEYKAKYQLSLYRSSKKILTHSSNERILRYGGNPIRLIAYGAYGIISEKDFDLSNFLNILYNNKINFVRIWINYHWTNSMSPFSKGEKYNLNLHSELYFIRLKNFVREAEQKGIIVQVNLFDACAFNGGNRDWGNNPYNQSQNVNGFISDSYSNSRKKIFNQIAGPVWDVNKKLIDKVTMTLKDFGNVIYEVMNEPAYNHTMFDQNFHMAVIQTIRENLKGGIGSKVISVNLYIHSDISWANRPEIDVVSFHVKPNEVNFCKKLYLPNKPIIISNDGDFSQINSMQTMDNHKGLDIKKREQRTIDFINNIFSNDTIGYYHFEFLDKGLYGKSWRTEDYNPSLNNVEPSILNILKSHIPINPDICVPPHSGDWIVNNSCTLYNHAKVNSNVIVEENSLLTIDPNASLDIDLSRNYLLVKKGSGVLVKHGGKIY